MSINPTFSTLWAVNGPLDLDELRVQLDDFVEAGLDGVVFHPRFYPDEPAYLGDEYLALVSTLIVDASERGLAFWIYDENGWPSGSVGGRMLERHPELRQRWVELQPDAGQPALRRFGRDGAGWALVERFGQGVDYLAPGLAGRFLELCYARYAEGLTADAFARVAGFFSDEPEFGLGHSHHELSPHGAIPWTPDLPERYAERHGGDLLDDLPAVFVGEARSGRVRERFWELVTDLFAERYLTAIDAWCRSRGVRFTAHVKGEEHPLFQLPTVGSLGPVVRAVGLPGIDALGRHAVNDFYPRQVSGIARQFGDGRTMAEAFGGAGWGATPADLEAYLRWLAGHGVTDFVLHLSQYRLDSAAIEDWPPSHPRHVSWSAAYADVLASVRAAIEAEPRPTADVLVVVPQRALARAFEPWEFVATNVHDAHDFPDTPAGAINAEFLRLVEALRERQVAYEFADERTLEREGRVVDGCLELGHSRYPEVVVPAAAVLDAAMAQALRPLVVAAAGLAPAAAGPVAPDVDAGTGAGAGAAGSPAPPPPPAPAVTPLRWRIEHRPVNELVLEPVPSDGAWAAVVEAADYEGPIEIRWADEPVDAAWGDAPVEVRRSGRGWVGEAWIERGARTQVRFRPRAALPPATVPRAWAAGDFLVRGRLRGRERSVSAFDGPFRLAAPDSGADAGAGGLDRELVEAGFPFLFEPLDLIAEVDVPPGTGALAVTGGVADAAGIRLGEAQAVWRWSGDEAGWTVPVEGAGPKLLRLRLVPSSFNRYGPHHHYLGDPPVVSPAQMQGARNYADADDAPERTHVAQWWVRRLVLPEGVVFRAATAPSAPTEWRLAPDVDNPQPALVK
ncbi:hypothetical protein GE115_08780 [Agromyces sp. CFH 90414]|uniref:Glycoside hydrolase n=1 Tax=Agromyces agglutinans TaxID=2662258 RepID=A0A6I2F6M2_9MICO|nr:hypothetical protein [Agromyces agglutinans]MRG59961.1 hypothetical protein [Agromyces agglutinans]